MHTIPYSRRRIVLISMFITFTSVFVVVTGGAAPSQGLDEPPRSSGFRIGLFGAYHALSETRSNYYFLGKDEAALFPDHPTFTNGSGTGMTLGGTALFGILPDVAVEIRALYHGYSGSASAEEEIGDVFIDPRNPTLGTARVRSEHLVTTSLSVLDIEPRLRYQVAGLPLAVGVGVEGMFLLSASYTMREEIVSAPSGYRFTGGERRDPDEGPVTQAQGLQLGMHAFLAWDIRISGMWTVTPEIGYRMPLSSGLDDASWKRTGLFTGVSVTLPLGGTADELPPTPPPVAAPVPAVEQQRIQARPALEVIGIDSVGAEQPFEEIRLTEIERSLKRSILPLVYFEEESFEIPSRYATAVSAGYSEEEAIARDPLTCSREILQLFGSRLTQLDGDKSVVVHLYVVNRSTGREATSRKSSSLADKRFEAVRNVLASYFPKAQIKRTSTPPPYSRVLEKQDILQGFVEIHITGSDAGSRPLEAGGVTTGIVNPSKIRFSFSTTEGVEVQSWRFGVTDAGRAYVDESGAVLPREYVWDLQTERSLTPGSPQAVLEITTPMGPAPVARTAMRITRERKADERRHVYDLLLPDLRMGVLLPEMGKERLAPLRELARDAARVEIEYDATVVQDKQIDAVVAELGIPVARRKPRSDVVSADMLTLYPEQILHQSMLRITIVK